MISPLPERILTGVIFGFRGLADRLAAASGRRMLFRGGFGGAVFVCEEVVLRFEQVARLKDHRLGLVEDREVEQAGFGAGGRIPLDADELALGGFHERVEQRVAHFEHQIHVGEILGAQHLVDLVEDGLHLVVHAHEVYDLFLREPRVVVVDVREGRAGDVYERLGRFGEVVGHLT